MTIDALDIIGQNPSFLNVGNDPVETNSLPVGVYQLSAKGCNCRVRIESNSPITGFDRTKGLFFKRNRSDLFYVGQNHKIAVMNDEAGKTGVLEIIMVGKRG